MHHQRPQPVSETHDSQAHALVGRNRLRFEAIDFECFPNGRCTAVVELEWKDRARFEGRAEGTHNMQGGLRAGALATLRAAESAAEGRLKLEFVGVKAVRAFDAWVTIAAVRARSEEKTYHLLGSYADLADPTPRSAALALLDATNRVMERYLQLD
jgi:hypothetical protein